MLLLYRKVFALFGDVSLILMLFNEGEVPCFLRWEVMKLHFFCFSPRSSCSWNEQFCAMAGSGCPCQPWKMTQIICQGLIQAWKNRDIKQTHTHTHTWFCRFSHQLTLRHLRREKTSQKPGWGFLKRRLSAFNDQKFVWFHPFGKNKDYSVESGVVADD